MATDTAHEKEVPTTLSLPVNLSVTPISYPYTGSIPRCIAMRPTCSTIGHLTSVSQLRPHSSFHLPTPSAISQRASSKDALPVALRSTTTSEKLRLQLKKRACLTCRSRDTKHSRNWPTCKPQDANNDVGMHKPFVQARAAVSKVFTCLTTQVQEAQ